MTVDFHTHVYPDLPFFSKYSVLRQARSQLRDFVKIYSILEHDMQIRLRRSPRLMRTTIEEFSSLGVGAHLLVESSLSDLKSAMRTARVGKSLVVAHPPLISNELI